jgi:hypothetical protein
MDARVKRGHDEGEGKVDRRIHRKKRSPFNGMDCRIKPGNDDRTTPKLIGDKKIRGATSKREERA